MFIFGHYIDNNQRNELFIFSSSMDRFESIINSAFRSMASVRRKISAHKMYLRYECTKISLDLVYKKCALSALSMVEDEHTQKCTKKYFPLLFQRSSIHFAFYPCGPRDISIWCGSFYVLSYGNRQAAFS